MHFGDDASMNIGFSVFSGTGNTLKVCIHLADRLEALGHRCSVSPIVKGDANPPVDCDCLVIGYPVHAFNCPRPVIDFIKDMPATEDRIPVYLVQTSGEPLSLNKAAAARPERLLRAKGYDVNGCLWYVMPYNIIFRHSDAMASRMWRVVQVRAGSDAMMISSLSASRLECSPVAGLVSRLLSIEHPGIRLIGRGFRADDRCIGCGLCERRCPQGNIRLVDGHAVFGHDCAGCMGCAFSCPVDAIHISILDSWRVNGRYDFEAASAGDEDVCRYCRGSYLEYFHRYES